MNVADKLLNVYTNINAALEHCNEALGEKGSAAASNLYEVGDKILEVSGGEDLSPQLRGILNGTSEFDLTVPSGATEIRNMALASNTAIKSLILAEDTKTIGTQAFYGCTSLTSADLKNIETINGYGFNSCSSLKNIILGNHCQTLGGSCFYGCGFEEITLPETLTSLGSNCFYNCSSLKTINIPSQITSIPSSCFRNCSALNNLTLSNSVTGLGDSCFRESGLTSMNIPSSVITLSNYIFQDCLNLNSLSFNNNSTITSIPSYFCKNCYSLLNLSLPTTITSISSNAFENCSSLEELNFSSANSYSIAINNYTFQNCSNLEKVTSNATIILPNGSYCFANCTNLKEFPFYLMSSAIGSYAFQNCGFVNLDLGNASCGMGSFENCTQLKTVIFSYGNGYSFRGCTSLEKATYTGTHQFVNQLFANTNLNTLILTTTEKIVPLNSTSVFTDTPIAAGTGYIYVPSSLLSAYQSATNWTTYSSQFRAIEDYPDITGG